jgi:hypothetical protein
MSDSARVESGSGLQLLIAAATVADARWRMVFTHAAEIRAIWQRQLGRETLTQLASLGRFGWVNLLGHVVQASAGGSVTEVRRVVDDADQAGLYAVLLGGDRLELTSVLGRRSREIVGAVATGDTGARTELNRALKSGHTRLEVSTWLLRARPGEARQRCLSVLDALARIDPPRARGWQSDVNPPRRGRPRRPARPGRSAPPLRPDPRARRPDRLAVGDADHHRDPSCRNHGHRSPARGVRLRLEPDGRADAHRPGARRRGADAHPCRAQVRPEHPWRACASVWIDRAPRCCITSPCSGVRG